MALCLRAAVWLTALQDLRQLRWHFYLHVLSTVASQMIRIMSTLCQGCLCTRFVTTPPPYLQHYCVLWKTVSIYVSVSHVSATMSLSPSFSLLLLVCVCLSPAAGVYKWVQGLLRCIRCHSCYHTKAPRLCQPSWHWSRFGIFRNAPQISNTHITAHRDTHTHTLLCFHDTVGTEICAPVCVGACCVTEVRLTLILLCPQRQTL